MTLAFDTPALGRPFEVRVTTALKRARAIDARLREAVVLMVLLNAIVWGGMIASARGMIDMRQVVDEAWSLGAGWIAAIPQVSVTISH
jgi:hypothetical protein